MLNLIERSIAKKIINLFLLVFFAVLTVCWSIEMLSKMNLLANSAARLSSFFFMSILFLPTAIAIILPFVLAISVAYVLQTLNQNNELVILNQMKKAKMLLFRPIILIAICFSILNFAVTNFLVPHGQIKLGNLISQASANFLSNVITPDNFIEIKKKIFIKIGQKSGDSILNNIFICDEHKKDITSYYYANNAQIFKENSGDFLVMNDGAILLNNKKNNQNSILRFKKYSLNLSNFRPPKDSVKLRESDLTLSYLLQHKAQHIAELHWRFSCWIYPLVFSMVALLFCGRPRVNRSHKNSPNILATVLFALLFFLVCYGIKNASSSHHTYILLYLLPIITIICSIVAIMYDFEYEPSRMNKKLRLWRDLLEKL